MLEHMYPVFILIGATIGVVLLYLWLQARNASHLSLALIRLNEQLQFDMPVFLRNAWPVLAQSGVLGITWKLNWFGVSMEGSAGKSNGTSVHREIEVGEMKLSIDFQQSQYNERRYFEEALVETFLLLLRTDMWIKAGTIDATFSHMSKLTLFLQHDMKNVAQFIQLMSDQLVTVPTGKEQQILDYLRAAAPLIRHRADHIVRTLTIGQLRENPLRLMKLQEELSQICKLYRLDCTITGNAQISVPENTLDGALDNILKNYNDISQRDTAVKPHVFITIQDSEADVKINISANNTPPIAHFERLFEPFWSSDPNGLGIGLYQTKQMLRICNGIINVGQSETGQLQFFVHVTK